jgi:hypothetical protein
MTAMVIADRVIFVKRLNDMKKFKCKVEIEYEYVIEIDDEKFANLDNDVEEGIGGKAWRDYFFDFENWEEHAEYLAKRKALGDEFIEGYGVPLVNGENPSFYGSDKGLERGINIKVISEEDVYVDAKEIK